MNIDMTKIKSLENTYMIGILASKEDNLPNIGYEKEPITIMKNSTNVVFYIKPICSEPKEIEDYINKFVINKDIYIGIDNQNLEKFPNEYKYKSDENKIEFIKKRLYNKLIIFKPKYSLNGDFIYKNLEIICIVDDNRINKNKKYLFIPSIKISNDEFEEKLIRKQEIQIPYLENSIKNSKYILCGEYIYGTVINFKKVSNIASNWKIEIDNNFKKLKFDEHKTNFIIKISLHNINFIESEFLKELNIKLSDYGIELIDNTTFYETQKNNYNINMECRFIENIKQNLLRNDLYYYEEDIINLHTSIKTNSLTILAGVSGSGKTQLAKKYLETMGMCVENGRMLLLPINPSYTDPEDLLGYLNPNKNLYEPSNNGFIDLLIKADNNPDELYSVIFDEMNLAQIEHWFSSFISLLEIDEKDRYLNLYSKDNICYNKEKYKHCIKLRNNIIFIGTINLDDTTKDLSDRVLDRTRIITLKSKSLADIININQISKESKLSENEYDNIKFNEFNRWIDKRIGIYSFTKREIKFLDDLNELIRKYDDQKIISLRVINEIGRYINNIPINNLGEKYISRDYAFDLSIKQRVLSKIRGSQQQLNGLILSNKINGFSFNNNFENENGEIFDFINSESSSEISNFEISKKEIKRKQKEINIYGYTN